MDNLQEIIAIMERDPAPGVVLIDESNPIIEIAEKLEDLGFFRSHSWKGLLNCLNLDLPTFLLLEENVSRELGEILSQYSKRKGVVEILDQKTKRTRKAEFDPRLAKILLVARREDIEILEEALQH